MKYVMSDIHGDFKNFLKMLRKIGFCAKDELFILGDILDKGEEHLRLYEFIRDTRYIFLIKGNHEYLCERYLKGEISAALWDACGGEKTRQEVERLCDRKKEELCSFLEKLPWYEIVKAGEEEYFLTHSGFHADFCVKNPKTGLVDIEASVKLAAQWDQEAYLFSEDLHYIPSAIRFDRKIIVGHHPTIFLEGFQAPKIYWGKKYLDIDTGNEKRQEGGRLSCLRLEDQKEFYV